jgi:hypothetical protein
MSEPLSYRSKLVDRVVVLELVRQFRLTLDSCIFDPVHPSAIQYFLMSLQ